MIKSKGNPNQMDYATGTVPTPPNDKVIHVSQCKNSMCPLKEVLKMTSNKNNDNFE